MYANGTYVVYGTNGPCRITETTYLDMPGCDTKRKYYVLEPVASKGSIIYSPVDNPKVNMREIMTPEAARQLLETFAQIEPLIVESEKFREETYREVMKDGGSTAIAGLIKTLYQRREERLAQGKKFTAVDERFLAEAMSKMICELSLSLGITKEEAEEQFEKAMREKEPA